MENLSEDQRSEERHLEEEEVEGTSQRRRGLSIPKWPKQLCSFDASGKCVSDNASAFSKHVAAEVRDPRNLLMERDWRKIGEEDKEVFWNRIKGNIFIEDGDLVKLPMIRHMTLKVAEHAHKDYRNNLKKEFYTERAAEERSHPPPNVVPAQWAELVAYWNKEKTKEVAEKNKINRQFKTMNHTTGTKSFARVRQEYRNRHGKEADPVTFFRECHTRKDKTWIDESSQRAGATMEGSLQTLVEAGQEDNEELRTRVYVHTMGPEKHNRVRGYGHGVTPDMVSYASSSSSTNSSRRSSKSAMAMLLTQNNELRLRNENSDKRIADLENKQNELYALFQQRNQSQPPPSPGTQQSGQGPPHHPPSQGQSQPYPGYPYAGVNQKPPYPMYPMHLTHVQHMTYMHPPPMPYMQQHPYQVPVYRPEMAASSGICPKVPAGGFSGMLAGAGFDVDLTRVFGSDGGSQGGEGSGPHSGADSVE